MVTGGHAHSGLEGDEWMDEYPGRTLDHLDSWTICQVAFHLAIPIHHDCSFLNSCSVASFCSDSLLCAQRNRNSEVAGAMHADCPCMSGYQAESVTHFCSSFPPPWVFPPIRFFFFRSARGRVGDSGPDEYIASSIDFINQPSEPSDTPRCPFRPAFHPSCFHNATVRLRPPAP